MPDLAKFLPNDDDGCDLCLTEFSIGQMYLQIGMAWCHLNCVTGGLIEAAQVEVSA